MPLPPSFYEASSSSPHLSGRYSSYAASRTAPLRDVIDLAYADLTDNFVQFSHNLLQLYSNFERGLSRISYYNHTLEESPNPFAQRRVRPEERGEESYRRELNERATRVQREAATRLSRQPLFFMDLINLNLDNIRGGESATNNAAPTLQEYNRGTRLCRYRDIQTRSNPMCPISHEMFSDDTEVLQLRGCGHVFMPSSIQPWLETHSTCPMCRHDIRMVSTRENNEPQPEPERQTRANVGESRPTTDDARETNETSNISQLMDYILQNSRTLSQVYTNILDASNNFADFSLDNVNENEVTFSYTIPSNTPIPPPQHDDID
jgi:hypothetical protein